MRASFVPEIYSSRRVSLVLGVTTRARQPRARMHPACRPVLLLLVAPRIAAVSHARLSRRAVASSAVLCSSLVLPRAAAASDFQTAEAATALQFAAAEAARVSRQRDSFELRRAFELKVSAVQDATTAREFVAASDAEARVDNKVGRAGRSARVHRPTGRGCLAEATGRLELDRLMGDCARGRNWTKPLGSWFPYVYTVGAGAGGDPLGGHTYPCPYPTPAPNQALALEVIRLQAIPEGVMLQTA